ncbi:N-glycosylase/DNA lyase [Pseudohyphozyma bogoriensis]|nr:N-glycosylase/DNA lyase [Pseudohyphozyma bogoriensis]
MAPIPSDPLLLSLTFLSPASLRSPLATTRVAQAAAQTTSLLVDVRFGFAFPSPLTAATRVFIEDDRPLDTVDVVIADVRGLPLCWNSGRRESFVVEDEGKGKKVVESLEGKEEGKEGLRGCHEVVALGGTFDHLHAGHKILLSLSAFLATKKIIVGVTDTKLLQKKAMKEYLEPLPTRINAVKAFLELFKPAIEHDVVAIDDVYGPTAWDPDVDALVVSDETRKGGDAVNEERAKNSLSHLRVYVINLIDSSGTTEAAIETKMGSTGIRKWLAQREIAGVVGVIKLEYPHAWGSESVEWWTSFGLEADPGGGVLVREECLGNTSLITEGVKEHGVKVVIHSVPKEFAHPKTPTNVRLERAFDPTLARLRREEGLWDPKTPSFELESVAGSVEGEGCTEVVRDAWDEAERRARDEGEEKTEWDDDTWWVDVGMLQSHLASLDPGEDHYLGGLSEHQRNLDNFGRIAFGGAGIIISRSLMRKMQDTLETCIAEFGDDFGGDGMLAHCAMLSRQVPLKKVVEVTHGLNQMDMQGDASGFMTAGTLAPVLTLHHWAGWLEMIPNRPQPDVIRLFQATVDAVGGQNVFRRWVFDHGGVVFTLGHSVVLYREALSASDINRVEWTWKEFAPRVPSRRARLEGTEKLSYYLSSVERVSANTTIFHHVCANASVQDSVSTIAVVWDTNAAGVPVLEKMVQKEEASQSWWRKMSLDAWHFSACPEPAMKPLHASALPFSHKPKSSSSSSSLPLLASAALPKRSSHLKYVLTALALLAFLNRSRCTSWLLEGAPAARPSPSDLTRATGEACGLRFAKDDGSERDTHHLVVRVGAVAGRGAGDVVSDDNVRLPEGLHPALSALRSRPEFFDPNTPPATMPVVPQSEGGCSPPLVHYVEEVEEVVVPEDPTLFFAMTTSPDRIVKFAPIWSHFLALPPSRNSHSGSRPGCLVINSEGWGDVDGLARANAAVKKAGTTCVVKESSRSFERYEERVLFQLRDAWTEAERRTREEGEKEVQWFVFGDDDTWWVDTRLLQKHLATMDHMDDHFIGALTETARNLDMFGKIAYGGAGIVVSRGLMIKLQETVEGCVSEFSYLYGGDSMMTHCVGKTKGIPTEDVLEDTRGMQQMDMKGDASGFLSAGYGPFISIHHWAGWLELIPNRVQTDIIKLFQTAVEVFGGQNLFRRWIFDNGGLVWTVGHSVILYRDPLGEDDLTKAEYTWEDHIPRRPARPLRPEGVEKYTYYIDRVERVSPSRTIFHHTCSHPGVQKSVKRISIVWDQIGKEGSATPLRFLPLSLAELTIPTVLKSGQSFRWHQFSVHATKPDKEEGGEVVGGEEWAMGWNDRTVVLRQDEKGLYYRSLFPHGSASHASYLADLTSDTTLAMLRTYFQLDVQLVPLYEQWKKEDKHFEKKVRVGGERLEGIRVLRQGSWETLISFICSSNNHISRIGGMVNRLCASLGSPLPHPSSFTPSCVHTPTTFSPSTLPPPTHPAPQEQFYAFPSPSSLTPLSTDTLLRELGFGYRAPFILSTALLIHEIAEREGVTPEAYLDGLAKEKFKGTLGEAREKLMEFKGVGRKVADCVALFGLGWSEVVPVDTHVFQIAIRDYSFPASKSTALSPVLHDKVASKLSSLWGPKAGWAQQVLFFADLKSPASPSSSSSPSPSPEKKDKREVVVVKAKWEIELEELEKQPGKRRRAAVTKVVKKSVYVEEEEGREGRDGSERYPTPASLPARKKRRVEQDSPLKMKKEA